MSARRAVKDANGDPERVREARKVVDAAKVALGERGPHGPGLARCRVERNTIREFL
jgi:hypothetical protein